MTATGADAIGNQHYRIAAGKAAPISFFTAQTDYVNPIGENMKIETGLRAAIRNFTSNSSSYLFMILQRITVPINSLNNNYKFTDQVYAAYATFSHKISKFTYQVGVRVESSQYNGDAY